MTELKNPKEPGCRNVSSFHSEIVKRCIAVCDHGAKYMNVQSAFSIFLQDADPALVEKYIKEHLPQLAMDRDNLDEERDTGFGEEAVPVVEDTLLDSPVNLLNLPVDVDITSGCRP